MAAAAAGASSATAPSRFECPEGAGFREFLARFDTPAEKDVAMTAHRWGSAIETRGLPGQGFSLIEDANPIRFRVLWAASAPELRDEFLSICPAGVSLVVTVPLESPMQTPTFAAELPVSRGAIPAPVLCRAMSKLCDRAAYAVCANALEGCGGPRGVGPVRAALASLDRGMGGILAALARKGGAGAGNGGGSPHAATAPPRSGAASGELPSPGSGATAATAAASTDAPAAAAAAPAAPPATADPAVIEALLGQAAVLDGVEADMNAAKAAGHLQHLRGLAARCGEVMTSLDALACGPPGSPARLLRKECLARAERLAADAEAFKV